MRVFIYLLQFKLNIKYRSSKKYIIFDALSRLFFDNELITLYCNSLNDTLDLNNYFYDILDFFDNLNSYTFQEFFINIFNEFRKQIIDDYIKKTI